VQPRKFSPLGIGFVAFGVFVLLVAIPYGVTSPSNVRAVVLSPTFWPTIVSWLIILLGAILVVMQLAKPFGGAAGDDEEVASHSPAAWVRLAATAVMMIALVVLTPVLGMVWTTMLCFAILSIIIVSPQPILSGVVAIILPLALYAFFNHVAGVAVPQGEFIQLP
jgi:putative tricarboxylic transport membrane protein